MESTSNVGGLANAIIFCCLPANQRFYLVIMPLLLVAIARGLLHLPGKWARVAFLLPLLLLSISIPLALENHREEPSPMKLVRYLKAHHPAVERGDVVLLARECERHVQWYAPEFARYYTPLVPFTNVDPKILENAKAIYTDDSRLVLTPGWKIVLVAEFHRSLLIELKQRDVLLHRVERTPTS